MISLGTAAPAYHVDGAPATRASFYAIACDPRRSVVVEACAGAGKTWMLVSRIVRALLDGAQPQEILAITFTRKAAGEMRTRLSQWLRQWSQADAASRLAALAERGVDAAQARELEPALKALHERVLSGGRVVEVHTFHAWFSQLLRAAPLDVLAELGLAPQLELIEDLDDLRPELFRRFHLALLDDAAGRADYAALLHRHGRAKLMKWLDAAWDKRIELSLADAAGTLEDGVPDAVPPWPDRAALAALAQLLGQRGKREIVAAGAIEAALGASDEVAFPALWKALFTKDGPPRKLADVAGLAAACDALLDVRDALDQREAHADHVRLVRLSRVLQAEYAALKRARSLADMSDLEQCALALLSDSAMAGWVQERLDARVRHVLIDEFQDTSPLQWHALWSWLSAYAGAGGGRERPGVFIVGDPKQSIYRFRRAEPRVFEAARRFVAEGLGGAVLECDHTRRNAPAVVDVLNTVFARLEAEGRYPGFRTHTTEVAAGGDVAALPGADRLDGETPGVVATGWRDSLATPRREPEEQLRDEEARQLACAVRDLVANRGVAPGDVLVLARKRVSLRAAAQALSALHVPFASPEEMRLDELPEVLDLVALLDVLASPGHDLSLARALKSPLLGADDAQLLWLSAQARERGVSWMQALAGCDHPGLERARRLVGRWSAAARLLPPHDLLDQIVAEGDLLARVSAAVPAERRSAALAAIDALLALSLQLDGARYATPYNFVRALRRRILKTVAPARPDAVQLLTIHGAKGLEARVVFVMDADPERQNADHTTLLVDWPVASPRPRRVAFVASEAKCPPSLRALLAEENAAREREELNGLYVAMTRAREQLVFSRTQPSRACDEPSWWARIAGLARPMPVPEVAAGLDDVRFVDVATLPPAPRRSAVANAPAPASDALAARLGQAVHRVLEWAAGPLGDTPVQALAVSAAAQFGLGPGHAGQVEAIAGRVLANPAVRRFFDRTGLRWAGNEVPVTGPEGEVLRIDRLVLLETTAEPQWWVLDYKIQHAPQDVEPWREQLRRYRQAVQILQPQARVRAAFITGAGELVEPGDAG